VLVFHRAMAGELGNSPEMLDAHFGYVADHHPCVLPGEPLQPGLNVCLSFDGGHFDFYHTVFPLLKKHHLRALLAVPAGLILGHSTLPPGSRLLPPDLRADPQKISGGLCTWRELREMADSDRVAFAAHGMTLADLDGADTNRLAEIRDSGVLLAVKLQVAVESFVFPRGRYSSAALQTARDHYRQVFGIGQTLNSGWEEPVLHRVRGDNMDCPAAFLTPAKLRHYRARAWWNRLCSR
jgi:peptidoglycan/xylan/chitin deacetylase (PgdA/CDA1 family)